MSGRVLQGHPDEADLGAVHVLDRVRREDRLVGAGVLHVGGEVVEVRAAEPVVRAGVLVVLALGAVGDAAALCPSAGAPCSPRRTRGCRLRRRRVRACSSTRSWARRGTRPRAAARRRSGHPRRRSGCSGGPCAPARGGWRGRRRRPRPAVTSSAGLTRSRGRAELVVDDVAARGAARWLEVAVEVVERQQLDRHPRAGAVVLAWLLPGFLGCFAACFWPWSGRPFPPGAAVAAEVLTVSRAQAPAARTPIRRRLCVCMNAPKSSESDPGRLVRRREMRHPEHVTFG